MSVRYHRLLAIGSGLLAAAAWLSPCMACAEEPISHTTIGTQTVGLAVGPFFPIRLMPSQSSKLFGAAAMPSWSVTLTDPIGSSWYQGQVALGAELLAFGTSEPMTATESEPHRNCNTPSPASIGYGHTPKVAEVRYGQISVAACRSNRGNSTLSSGAEPEPHGF